MGRIPCRAPPPPPFWPTSSSATPVFPTSMIRRGSFGLVTWWATARATTPTSSPELWRPDCGIAVSERTPSAGAWVSAIVRRCYNMEEAFIPACLWKECLEKNRQWTIWWIHSSLTWTAVDSTCTVNVYIEQFELCACESCESGRSVYSKHAPRLFMGK